MIDDFITPMAPDDFREADVAHDPLVTFVSIALTIAFDIVVAVWLWFWLFV